MEEREADTQLSPISIAVTPEQQMSDDDRRSEISEQIAYCPDRQPRLHEEDGLHLRREGWLSGSPALPTVDDVERALAILAIIAATEAELATDAPAIIWLN